MKVAMRSFFVLFLFYVNVRLIQYFPIESACMPMPIRWTKIIIVAEFGNVGVTSVQEKWGPPLFMLSSFLIISVTFKVIEESFIN